MPASDHVVGWDIGGAHVKACVLRHGEVEDLALWACPLWQGLAHLEPVFRQARERWPDLAKARHALTMTGEMVDLFEHREDGVRRIAALVARELPAVCFYAGQAGWCEADAATHWEHIASANWRATAQHVAHSIAGGRGEGVLIDIGSTTTDLIVFKAGAVPSQSRSDADRLASGELVYHGVVRTPLCALAQRIGWRGAELNVMNEWFATTADVYRLTGELEPAHDLQASADAAAKDMPATRRRLARMIGFDERDAGADQWLTFAQAWRACQVAELASQLQRVTATHRLASHAVVVSAGCGAFLVADVVAAAGLRHAACVGYGSDVARIAPGDNRAALAAWAQVCAPCVAVATLLDREQR